MNDAEFDEALIGAAFAQAALTGWRAVSIVEAARAADLPLDRARARFPGPGAVLMRLGLLADSTALREPPGESSSRDRLFDLLMRRFDVLQRYRAGVLALLSALPKDPLLSLAMGAATLRSMAWMLEAGGLSSAGLRGMVRIQALLAVWLYGVRAWQQDESTDLVSTMAALDKALDRAEQVFDWIGGAGLSASRAANNLPPEIPEIAAESPPVAEPPSS